MSGAEFPDMGCRTSCCGEPKDCGMKPAGVGFQCREGSACGRYLQVGDEFYAEVKAWWLGVLDDSHPETQSKEDCGDG